MSGLGLWPRSRWMGLVLMLAVVLFAAVLGFFLSFVVVMATADVAEPGMPLAQWRLIRTVAAAAAQLAPIVATVVAMTFVVHPRIRRFVLWTGVIFGGLVGSLAVWDLVR